jgi:glycerate 2-kinase
MRVLIVPDKFKSTLTAAQAARAIAVGWRRERPHDHIDILPTSDGGDGFGVVMSDLLGARAVTCKTVNAAHQRHKARWWWDARRKTAIIETANIIGLAMLPHGKFHPFELDTFGVGAVLDAAENRGATSCLIGIGGSATNDGGFGLAKALGWGFLEKKGVHIERWIDLEKLQSIPRPPSRSKLKIRVAVDVQNPLLGSKGATRVYGPQKGLTAADFPHAESCLARLARVVRAHSGTDFSRWPGSGAAGGLGFGLAAFAGADLEPGFELFCQYADLDARLARADLVITGEGAIDASSLMGKGAGQIALKCRRLKIPCMGIAGRVDPSPVVAGHFTRLYQLISMTTPAKALAQPALWLSRLARQAAHSLKTGAQQGLQRVRGDRSQPRALTIC